MGGVDGNRAPRVVVQNWHCKSGGVLALHGRVVHVELATVEEPKPARVAHVAFHAMHVMFSKDDDNRLLRSLRQERLRRIRVKFSYIWPLTPIQRPYLFAQDQTEVFVQPCC